MIAAGLRRRIDVKAVGYTQGRADLTAPLTAAGATTADFVAPYGSAADCANQANALKQLGITDSRKIMTAPLCLSPQVSAALGDWPLWTYAIASSNYGDPTDKGMPAYQRVIKRYKAEKNAPDPWHIVAFSELLTTVRFLNEAAANNVSRITPKRSWHGRRCSAAARARVAEAPVRQVQERAGYLQRHVPGVHLPGQVRVQAGVRLDRAAGQAVDERRPFIRRGRLNPGPVG